MFGFYIFGMTDMQDIIPVLLTSLSKGKKCWVCIFDTVLSKRQFYYYEPEEVVGFIKKICHENDLPVPEICFYGVNDRKQFEENYKSINPSTVFIQNITHNNISWYPIAGNANVVHLAWHKDGAKHACNSCYDISLNALRKEYDLNYFGAHGIDRIPEWFRHRIKNVDMLLKQKTKYYGNLRVEHLQYNKVLLQFPESLENKKVCFIVESHIRNDPKFQKETGKFVDKLIVFLRSKGYYIIWKNREKGWPKDKWCSPLDFSIEKPDFVIKKDLNFPSSLLYGPTVADLCLTLNCTNAIFDIQDINPNSFMLNPPSIPKHEDEIFNRRFKGHATRIILDGDESWASFAKLIDAPSSISIPQSKASHKLLEDIELL